MDLAQYAGLGAAAVAAGAINSIAGGGTLVSFPAAMALGLNPLVANATNAVAMTPGSVAAAVGYRRELGRDKAVLKTLTPVTAAGAAVGAGALLCTSARTFAVVVPVLVAFATVLLFVQNVKAPPSGAADEAWELPARRGRAALLQFCVGVYGGYFGAGMGLMMLVVLGRLGGRNIHRMNGVRSALSGLVNAVASVGFLAAGAVDFRAAGVMSVGMVAGGFVGAKVARRVNPRWVRWAVVGVGVVMSVKLARGVLG
jgi:hypothetical protein